MNNRMKEAADSVLTNTVAESGGAPGVVAMVTDRRSNIYEGTAGVREMGKTEPIATDSVFAIFSCTKALTGTALMQLVEEGLVTLDDPARDYVPDIAEIQVLDGFDSNGQPKLRAPKSDITINQLMLHTAGFGYEFFSHDDLAFRTARETASVVSSTYDGIKSVLLHDPGERWMYGVNLDWVGKIVEAVRGKRLGQVMQERIFNPLGMTDSAFTLTPAMRSRLASLHTRAEDGQLAPWDLVLPQPPEMDMGGHGLYGTVPDYMKFIRMILNDGAGPDGRVLNKETVEKMSRNGLVGLQSGGWTTSMPALSNSGEFFPGLKKSWGYTFQINDEPTPSGRPAGQIMWAGLANLFYWIDRQNGIGGMWASQILPFKDISSYPGFVDFESSVYRYLK
jgi:methyl acetate hydrolase